MLLSIIIPMYNCAPAIVRCLESIDDIDAEVIVVDDGSQDESAEMVLEYSNSHPNVLIVKKENGGVSSARNVGIEIATGKYIMFVDADDTISPGGINVVLDLAEQTNADIVKYKVVFNDNQTPDIVSSVRDFPLTVKTILGQGSALDRYDFSDYHVVDALFKRSLVIDNNIRFHTDLSLREDDVFMGEFLCHASKVVITDLPLYQYVRSSPFSSTHKTSIERQRALIQSGYCAVVYRYNYVKKFHPESLTLERLKYMRWVCQPKTAIKAGYNLTDYRVLLHKFKKYGCWPLDYHWIHVAGMDYSLKSKCKYLIKTFLCNHPKLAFCVLRFTSR